MSEPAVAIRNISKRYQLGTIGRHTLVEEVAYWWHCLRGRDPARHMGKIADGTRVQMNPTGDQKSEAFWALRDVSFDVQPGEVVGVIGRNGAGKSTLLKILSRITSPTSGEVEVQGRIGSLLEVGTGFHPELTGRENVYMNGTILGMKKAEIAAKFDEIVAFAEMDQFIDTPVKRYSSGMYVRLAFSVAAHLEPDILLVDEVLAVGDMEFQKKCLGKMQEVSEGGRTILFVSHNMAAISRLCSKAALLDKGQLVRFGLVDDVLAHYMSKSLGASSRREWLLGEAPGYNGFLLLSIRAVGAGGCLAGSFVVTEKLGIEMTYSTKREGMKFRCLISLSTQGTCAFSAVEPEERMHEQAGVYKTIVWIPAHLLAEGEYLVGLFVFASRGGKVSYIRMPDAIAFQVTDPIDGSTARGNMAEPLAGVVRPKLEWSKAYLGVDTLEAGPVPRTPNGGA